RATLATMTEEDAGRWALEADEWMRAATQLQGALLAAALEDALDQATPKPAAGASAAGVGTDGGAAAAQGPVDAGTPAKTITPKPVRSTKSKTAAKRGSSSQPKEAAPPPPPPQPEPAAGSFWHSPASADLLRK